MDLLLFLSLILHVLSWNGIVRLKQILDKGKKPAAAAFAFIEFFTIIPILAFMVWNTISVFKQGSK